MRVSEEVKFWSSEEAKTLPNYPLLFTFHPTTQLPLYPTTYSDATQLLERQVRLTSARNLVCQVGSVRPCSR